MKLLLATIIALTPTAAFAGDRQSGWSHQEKCFKTVYREEYVPGTMRRPGYVKSYKERVKIPCGKRAKRYDYDYGHRYDYGYIPPTHHTPTRSKVDDNSCIEGTVAGGLLGGALGGVLSTKDNWIWAIPAGMVGGAMAGCQVDGG
jgi:hypothetical protein